MKISMGDIVSASVPYGRGAARQNERMTVTAINGESVTLSKEFGGAAVVCECSIHDIKPGLYSDSLILNRRAEKAGSDETR